MKNIFLFIALTGVGTIFNHTTPLNQVPGAFVSLPAVTTDSDNDGLTDVEESKRQAHPFFVDSDNDGLPDDWETTGFRTMLPGVTSISPHHADVIVYIKWRPDLVEANVRAWVDRGIRFYRELNVTNPDKSSGINVIPVYGGALPASENGEIDNGILMNRYLPSAWRGLAHWMQFYNGSMGQTISPTCSSSGSDGTWQTFVHELGHQFGLEHEPPGSLRSPLHRSLMNYDYDFSIYDDPERIQFSDGRFAGLTLNENDLSERLHFPIAQVNFLEYGPYRYRLRADGASTLVDWNWNGVFGEEHIKADINGLGELSAGRLDPIEYDDIYAHGSVCAVADNTNLYLVFPNDETLLTPQAGVGRLGPRKAALYLWKKGSSQRIQLTDRVVTGDPSSVIFENKLHLCYPVEGGYIVSEYNTDIIRNSFSSVRRISPTNSVLFQATVSEKPQLSVIDNSLYLFTWKSYEEGPPPAPAPGRIIAAPFLRQGEIQYIKWLGNGRYESAKKLAEISQSDIGVCWDITQRKLCLVRTKQTNFPNRLNLLRYNLSSGEFRLASSEMIGGTNGPNRTTSRPTVTYLRDSPGAATGKVYLFYKGWTGDPYALEYIYCSRSIADNTINGGWQEMMWGFQTKSGVTATPYNNNIAIAFRANSGHIGLAYSGTGLDNGIMKDFNELMFIRNTGLKNSLASAR